MIENTWEENGQSGEHCLKKKKSHFSISFKNGFSERQWEGTVNAGLYES